MSRGGRLGTNWASSGDVVVVVDFARVSRSLGPDNKDIHYARRSFFSARNERPVCFAGSSCLSPGYFYVCVCCLPPSFVPASVAIYARRRSRPRRRLKCNRRKLKVAGRWILDGTGNRTSKLKKLYLTHCMILQIQIFFITLYIRFKNFYLL